MAVKRGYKQTEVGVIPEDWSVMPFAQAVGSYIDYRGRTPRKLGLTWGGGDILALSANNVQMGRIDPNKESYFGSEELYRKWMVQGECEPGDVLLTMEAPLGNITQIPDSKKYILSQRVLLIKPKGWLLRDYLAHYMKGTFFQAQLALNATGSTAKGIQRRKLDELLVYLPPTKAEQGAIAEALSDADALIESLEQLLAKKLQLKQGAMGELLTGKKRLPDFEANRGYKPTEVGVIPEDWALEYIEDLAHITTGSRNTQDRVDDGLYPFFVRSQTVERINSYSFDGEAVLTAGDGVGTGKVFHYINGKFDAHQRVYRISDFNERVNSYFFYLYFSCRFYNRIMQMTAKSSVDSVRREMIARMLVPLPPTKGEQEAIAAILSDMDAEITALEAKLAKARQLKQGMMQELLMGRIRLV